MEVIEVERAEMLCGSNLTGGFDGEAVYPAKARMLDCIWEDEE